MKKKKVGGEEMEMMIVVVAGSNQRRVGAAVVTALRYLAHIKDSNKTQVVMRVVGHQLLPSSPQIHSSNSASYWLCVFNLTCSLDSM